MKLILLAALVSTQAFANTDHNINVGLCTAFHILRSQGNSPTSTPALAEIIMRQSTDVRMSQQAAHKFIDLFEKDRDSAVRVGFNACKQLNIQ